MSNDFTMMSVSDAFVSRMETNRKSAQANISFVPFSVAKGVDLSQWCGPVFDQGIEESCTACTVRDYLLWLQNKYNYNPIIDPSVNAIYYYGRLLFGNTSANTGCMLSYSMQGTVLYGVIPTEDDPYGADTLYTWPSSYDAVFVPTGTQSLVATTANIRSTLDSGQPVGISILVMQSLSIPVNGVIDISEKVPNKSHAVFCCAYKPDPVYEYLYKIQNSWGTLYGENGYAWLTEAYLKEGLWEICVLDISPTLTPIPIFSPTPVPTPAPTLTPDPQPKTLVSISVSFISSTGISLRVGAIHAETIFGLYSDGTKVNITSRVTFSSSNPSAATISPNGIITAVDAGSSVITATLDDKTSSVNVIVTADPSVVYTGIRLYSLYNGITQDITNVVKVISCSGDKAQAARKLDITYAYPIWDRDQPRAQITTGTKVWLLLNGKEIFRGIAWDRTLNSASEDLVFVAYDYLIYLTKSKVTYNFANITPEDATAKICDELGIEVGVLAGTGIPVSRLIAQKTGYEAIMELYTQASKTNGKQYIPVMDGLKLSVIEKGSIVANYTLISQLDGVGNNMISTSYRDTMDGMINRVKVYSGDNAYISEVSNDVQISNYGLIQDNYTEEKDKDSNTVARGMLTGLQQDVTIPALGNWDCRTGYAVNTSIEYIDILQNAVMYIEGDTHTWEVATGKYTMSLNLSFKNSMDNKG